MSDYEKQVEEFNEEENMEEDILELVGDDGEVEHFYHLATLEYKKEWYVVLQPTETTESVSEDELLIFRLATDEKTGEDVFMTIDDEKTLNAVYDEYLSLVESDDCCDCHEHHHHHDDDCDCDECHDDDCDCDECHDSEEECGECSTCEEDCTCSGCEEEECGDCACATCEEEECGDCVCATCEDENCDDCACKDCEEEDCSDCDKH